MEAIEVFQAPRLRSTAGWLSVSPAWSRASGSLPPR